MLNLSMMMMMMMMIMNIKIAVSLIFAAATFACHFASVPSCAGLTRMHEGWRWQFRVMQAKRERKPRNLIID